MKITYFSVTDTLYVHFSDRPIVDTRDVNENVLVELDDAGQLVAMTMEHAADQTDVKEFTYNVADEH